MANGGAAIEAGLERVVGRAAGGRRWAGPALAGCLLLTACQTTPPPPPAPPPPYIASVPAAVLRAQREEPPWRFLRSRDLSQADRGLEFPAELSFEIVATEPGISAVVVRPVSWRGRRAANYLVNRPGQRLLTKGDAPEQALTFRLYLAFAAPGPSRIQEIYPDEAVPSEHDNLRFATSQAPFIDNRIADLGLALRTCEDRFAYHYETIEDSSHEVLHVPGSAWIVDPIPPALAPTASHALLLLAESFDLQLALDASSPLAPTTLFRTAAGPALTPAQGLPATLPAPSPTPPGASWDCPPPLPPAG